MSSNKYINKLNAIIRILGDGDSSPVDLHHININEFHEGHVSKKTKRSQVLATLREIRAHLEEIEK